MSGVKVTLAEELLLFAYNEETGRAKGSSAELGCGLAGALLVELALAGRIDVLDGKVSVLDRAPVGEPESDAALHRIAVEGKPRKPDWWVAKLRSGVRGRLLNQLTARGVLQIQRQKILWVFPARRYPALDRSVEAAVRVRMDRVVAYGGEPDERTAALAGLLDACGLARRAFPDVDRDLLKARMKELSEGQWNSEVVRKAIKSVQAAIAAASTAGAVAATSATTS